MKCPLLSSGEYTRNVSSPTTSCDCFAECAHWDRDFDCCNEVAKTKVLKLIHEDLYVITVAIIEEVRK